jgi:hypothetical protein
MWLIPSIHFDLLLLHLLHWLRGEFIFRSEIGQTSVPILMHRSNVKMFFYHIGTPIHSSVDRKAQMFV